MIGILFVIISAALTLLYVWTRQHNGYWSRTRVPHIPASLPFIGHFWPTLSARRSLVDLFGQFYSHPAVREAPIFGVNLFYHPTLFVRHPDAVRQLLVRDFAQFGDHFAHSDTHDALGNSNVLMMRNPLWRRLRQRLTPFFTSGKLRQMSGLVADVGDEMDAQLRAMPAGVELEVKEFAARYATDVIATCAYGVQANSLANPESEFRQNGRKVFEFTLHRMLELTTFFFLPEWSRLMRFRFFGADASKFIKSTIEYVMGEREKTPLAVRNDLIDTLVQLKNEDRDRRIDDGGNDFLFSSDILVAQAGIFFTAGYETTASTISFGLYELARRPDVQKRLRAEIGATLLASADGRLTYDMIALMEYMHMVVSEVLRLHPILPFLDRRCTLPAGQKTYSMRPFADYDLPDGMGIIVPVAAIHRDPAYWPQPDRFDPERFAPANRANVLPYTFMPFGVGPRSCLGERFGWLSTKMGLASFLRNHCVTLSPRMATGPIVYSKRAMFLQSEGGIMLNVVKDALVGE